MVAEFNEVRAARLRLTITDASNPPLSVAGFTFGAAARQIVVSRELARVNSLALYYGNPEALPPEYDFARNLPERLQPAPDRGSLDTPQPNPAFIPEPKPLTERWPWMVYVVLGAVSLVLAGLIVSVGRRAIDQHDGGGNAKA
jgi:hypothetical protein